MVFDVDFVAEIGVRDGTNVLVLGGDVDVFTAPRMRSSLDELTEATSTVVVDMSGIKFFSAAGINELVRTARLAQTHGGSLRLVGVTPHVRELLCITGVDRHLLLDAA